MRDTVTPWRGVIRTRFWAASCCIASRTGVRDTENFAASARSSRGAPGGNSPLSISAWRASLIVKARLGLRVFVFCIMAATKI